MPTAYAAFELFSHGLLYPSSAAPSGRRPTWSVLEQLARSPEEGPLTPSQLAEAANVAPSSMTHRLDRMAERGMVERSADPGNRVRVQVRLTDAGYRLYAQAIREANLVEADVLAGLTARQVQTLGDLLEKVLAGLDDADV